MAIRTRITFKKILFYTSPKVNRNIETMKKQNQDTHQVGISIIIT